MPVVFLPDHETLFLWDKPSPGGPLASIGPSATPQSVELIVPEGRRLVSGLLLPLFPAISALAQVPASALAALPGSEALWTLASKLAFELVARERVVPAIRTQNGESLAYWAAALGASEDGSRVALLASCMPPSAHAVPVAAAPSLEVWAPEALLRRFLDAAVDSLVRFSCPPQLGLAVKSSSLRASYEKLSWELRWRNALLSPNRRFDVQGFTERALPQSLERWSEPAIAASDSLRACFRLELPESESSPFTLRFLLQSPQDPSLMVGATEVWKTRGQSLQLLGRAFRSPQESLLRALQRAARVFAPIGRSLDSPAPDCLALDASGAWEFISEGAQALSEVGFGVLVPGELTAAGQRRIRLRMRVGSRSKVAGTVSGSSQLDMQGVLSVNWDAVLGDRPLTAKQLDALASQKIPLVRHRGAWVAIDPRELAEIQKRLASGPGRIPIRDALRTALLGQVQEGTLSIQVSATGAFAQTLERIQQSAGIPAPAPKTLCATLRPYQQRGLGWLSNMGMLGLGACLADDMGLGKTIQLLAFLLHRREASPKDKRPVLLVAPTSVVGNWEREVAKFAPSLAIHRHYGSQRARLASEFLQKPGALVITTYGLLRRDSQLLAEVDWAVVALDEAQNIKNAASATARAARSLSSSHRFALTGTPVENRLAELWSILEFANPGLLGPMETFRKEYAIPIERYSDENASERLRRMVGPFVLRRLKSDPTIIEDLPAKNEMKVVCTLTPEQATLYKAVVDEALERIEKAEGIERRGQVLALLMGLKQICNHPAQYLAETGPLSGRSGKLARLTEMLQEALDAGDRALIFTQFREMGERLLAHLQPSLGCEIAFLHGGSSKKARDEMVRRFQEDPHGPRVFILSLKAGGTGLNLTAASHVFHYDRWWNPAVEDQATDRAWRIGQSRMVQVHKLMCAGTVEEKVDSLLEQKRVLASKVVSAGEKWITEMGNDDLRDLFSLSSDAIVEAEEPEEAIKSEKAPPKKRVSRAKKAGVQA